MQKQSLCLLSLTHLKIILNYKDFQSCMLPSMLCLLTGQLTSISVDACRTKASEWRSRVSVGLRRRSSETDKTSH